MHSLYHRLTSRRRRKVYTEQSHVELLETRALLSAQQVVFIPFDEGTTENVASDIQPSKATFSIVRDETHGSVAEFNGNGELVIPLPVDLELAKDNGDFSVSFFIKPTAAPVGIHRILDIASDGDPYNSFSMDLGGGLLGWVTNDVESTRLITNGRIPVNQWTHVSYVKTGNTLQFFLNGQLDEVDFLAWGRTTAINGSIRIGEPQFHKPVGNFRIDDFRVHERALSAGEVRAFSDTQGPVAFYDFEHASIPGFDSSPAGEGRTTGQDDAALRADGSLKIGATVTVDSEFGNVLKITSDVDSLVLPQNTDREAALNSTGQVRDGFTMSYFVKLSADADGQFRALTSSGTQTNHRTFATFLRPESNRIHFRISTNVSANEGGNSVAELEVGRWTHVAYVKDGSKLKLFLDGRLDSEVTLSGNVVVPEGRLRVGRALNTWAARASFDKVGLYPFAMSSKQILNTIGSSTIEFSAGEYIVDENAGSVTLTVNRNGHTNGRVFGRVSTFDLTTNGDGTDYEALSPGAQIDMGDLATSTTVVIPITDDSDRNGDRQFAVSLFGPLGTQRVAYVTIRDDESTSHPPIATPRFSRTPDGRLRIETTAADDVIRGGDLLGTTHDVTINGVLVSLDGESVEFDSGGGNDSFTMMARWNHNDKLVASPDSFELTGTPNNDAQHPYSISGTGFELVDVQQPDNFSTNDTAWLHGSNGDDVFVGKPGASYITNGSYTLIARDFPTVVGNSAGGNDETQLFDTGFNNPDPRNRTRTTTADTLILASTYAKLTGFESPPRYSSWTFEPYTIWAMDFDRVRAFATDGADSVRFDDSPGSDRFVGGPEFGQMTGDGFNNSATGFDFITARSIAGGFDSAELHDSAGDDHYVGRPDSGLLTGDGLRVSVNLFETVVVFANQGNDTAELFDSAGNDFFIGRSDLSAMFDAQRSYAHTLKSFELVDGYATAGGDDEAQFYDSVGNDRVDAIPGNVRLTTENGKTSSAFGFSRVGAFSTKGGSDVLQQLTGLDYLFVRFGDWIG